MPIDQVFLRAGARVELRVLGSSWLPTDGDAPFRRLDSSRCPDVCWTVTHWLRGRQKEFSELFIAAAAVFRL
jgi:hypothetical protein